MADKIDQVISAIHNLAAQIAGLIAEQRRTREAVERLRRDFDSLDGRLSDRGL